MEPLRLSDLASRYGLIQRGPDREVVTFGRLLSRTSFPDRQLSYAIGRQYFQEFLRSRIGACIVPQGLAEEGGHERSLLLTADDPEDVFYTIFTDLAESGRWQTIEKGRGSGLRIAPTAVVYDPVWIGDDCHIMDHVVIFPNTRLGNRVTIKPNSTVGGYGFEVKRIHGRRRLVPHAGGVWLEDDVEVGSATCIDRGLFGDLTYLGPETKVDNLVHVGHGIYVGRGCSLTACVEISGGVTLGDGVWLGPGTVINNQLVVGDHCYVGIGAVVTRSLPNHALAYGSPAKVKGWVCACRAKLALVDNRARCERCDLDYVLANGQVERWAA